MLLVLWVTPYNLNAKDNMQWTEAQYMPTCWLLGDERRYICTPALFWEAGTSQWRISPRYEGIVSQGQEMGTRRVEEEETRQNPMFTRLGTF